MNNIPVSQLLSDPQIYLIYKQSPVLFAAVARDLPVPPKQNEKKLVRRAVQNPLQVVKTVKKPE